jgi:hypothetical protein
MYIYCHPTNSMSSKCNTKVELHIYRGLENGEIPDESHTHSLSQNKQGKQKFAVLHRIVHELLQAGSQDDSHNT